MNIHKSVGPNKMHPRILRKLADVIKPLTIISEKSWQLGEVPGGWKKDSIGPIFKKGEKDKSGKYHPQSWERSWSRLFQNLC